jgi:hypothetical protein
MTRFFTVSGGRRHRLGLNGRLISNPKPPLRLRCSSADACHPIRLVVPANAVGLMLPLIDNVAGADALRLAAGRYVAYRILDRPASANLAPASAKFWRKSGLKTSFADCANCVASTNRSIPWS